MTEDKKKKEKQTIMFYKPSHVETNIYNIYIGKKVTKDFDKKNDKKPFLLSKL